jgi:hypothetical protein
MLKKMLLVPAALLFVNFLGVPAANAEPQQCFTLDSLDGNYAVIGTYGANVALALAVRHFDGKGNLTGSFVLNEPTPGSTTGARTIVTGTQVGTYTVNCDGTGVITRTVTASNGVTATQTDNFIITKAKIEHSRSGQDRSIATALVDAQQTPSAIVPGGIFLTRSYTRLPDDVGDDPNPQQ